jgi:hypothetical protein
MKILIEVDKEKMNTTLNQVRGFREDFLRWTVYDESPAKYPEDILWYLRVFNDVDLHLLDIMKKLWEDTDENQCQDCAHKDKIIELNDGKCSDLYEAIGLLKEKLNEYQEKCAKLTEENILLYKERNTVSSEKEPEN